MGGTDGHAVVLGVGVHHRAEMRQGDRGLERAGVRLVQLLCADRGRGSACRSTWATRVREPGTRDSSSPPTAPWHDLRVMGARTSEASWRCAWAAPPCGRGCPLRFFPEAFAMASHYGAPEGSIVAVTGRSTMTSSFPTATGWSGGSGSPVRRRGRWCAAPPMHPRLTHAGPAGHPTSQVHAKEPRGLGWRAGPVPFAINAEHRLRRPACVGCPQCVGHAWPVDALRATHSTPVPQALAAGRCDFLMQAQAVEAVHDGRGGATAVRAVVD